MAVGKVHHFSETPPHHDARTCQSEGERHPYANESVAHYESAQIAYGQRNDEEGYEGKDEEGALAAGASQGTAAGHDGGAETLGGIHVGA